jgi:hypothetical protein
MHSIRSAPARCESPLNNCAIVCKRRTVCERTEAAAAGFSASRRHRDFADRSCDSRHSERHLASHEDSSRAVFTGKGAGRLRLDRTSLVRSVSSISITNARLREGRTADLVDVLIVGRGGGSTEDLWASIRKRSRARFASLRFR